MRIFGRGVLVSAALLAFAAGVRADAPTPEQVKAALDAGVKALIAQQQADGSWKETDIVHGGGQYDVGRTALAVLALEYAEKHVKNDKVAASIDKGLAFVLNRNPEPKTYTAGLVMQAAYKANPAKYKQVLFVYSWMTMRGQMIYGTQAGAYSYGLYPFPKDFDKSKTYEPAKAAVSGRGDNSNTQFAAIAMQYSDKAGVKVPEAVWDRLYNYWTAAQHEDGGWDYQSDAFRDPGADMKGASKPAIARPSTWNMTCAGTVSTALAQEALTMKHETCKAPVGTEPVDRGIKWLVNNLGDKSKIAPYGWYACARLGVLLGQSDFGGLDWCEMGAASLVGPVGGGGVAADFSGPMPNLALGIIVLSRGLEPVAINKLKRVGDWNLHPHDLGHLTDYVTETSHDPVQWRIASLQQPLETLSKVRALWISGHDKLTFGDEEKARLKEYVEKGGTIVAEACCGKTEFDRSFRALVAEMWPGGKLAPLDAKHALWDTPRVVKADRPEVDVLGVGPDATRFGVIYFPRGISCKWERNTKTGSAMDMGWNILSYVQR